MKKITIILFIVLFSLNLLSQEKLYIHKSDKITLGAFVSATDSIYFNSDRSIVYFQIAGTLTEYPLMNIDSLSFGPNSDTVFVNYDGSSVSVINPFAYEGVNVTVNGADVIVTATTEVKDIFYHLSGQTSDGMFKIYTEKRFNLILDNVNITNNDGPAINNQANNKVTVILENGSENYLTDGANYSTAPINNEGEEEDQKAAFFSEGKIVFTGTGSLTIYGNGTEKHGLCSDDLIQIESGSITIASAANDGIHGKDGFSMTDGTINVKAIGDGIDGDEGYLDISGGSITVNCSSADAKAIKSDSALTVSGGIIDITISGNESKGFKCSQDMTFSGGTITINTSGGVVLNASGSGYDPSYCTGIKGEGNILVSGANITIISTGIAGKGVSGDLDFTMTDGVLSITTKGNGATYKNTSGTTDAYRSTCISVDGNINISGGNITTSSSGKAGMGFNCDGDITIGSVSTAVPTIDITTTGASITISSSGGGGGPGGGQNTEAAESKAIKCDGAFIFNIGTLNISSADDGIKSPTSITINNGTISITKSYEGIESPLITVNNGNVSIVSSDDSFNATYGNGGEANDKSKLNINGGYIVANASAGDPLDSNGDFLMNGGTMIVHGPPSQPEVGLDVNGTTTVSGGFLVISSLNSNMTDVPGTTSAQYSLVLKTNQNLSNSTLFHIQDSGGNNIVTFQPIRNYSLIIFSSSALKTGETYSIFTGGTCTGTVKDGLYTGGTYTGGTLKKTFSITSKVTTVQF